MGKATREKKTKVVAPGRATLDEDLTWVTGSMRLRQLPPVTDYRVPVEQEAVSLLDVEDRIMRAMRTLRSMPDRERRFFVVKSGHPQHVQEYIDAYAAVEASVPRFNPTPFDVSDYLKALSWARVLNREGWKILWWRSFDLSFGTIAKYIGRSDETARRRYKEALVDAWAAANGSGASRAA